jgi:serine/threonine protein kinase
LRQLLAGESADSEHTELIAHLDHCAACQRTLERLAGANPAFLSAAGALQRTAFTEEPTLLRVLDDLKDDTQQTLPYRSQNRLTWVRSLLEPAQSPQALGQLGGYEATELLGQGSMGLVLKAYDPALKRWVALKVLAPDLASDEVARQRFAREAQAAAAVRHEHVVTIHAVSEANGLPYMVMEYIPGGSLQDYLDQNGRPDWQTVGRLGAEIASGLAAAHARGMVHRDIKPSNILLQSKSETRNPKSELSGSPGIPLEPSNGERSGSNSEIRISDSGYRIADFSVKIADFGLARVGDDLRLTRTGIVAGTPMYMSPEQARCEPLDQRSDLFSLGSVLYTLCTGKEPFPSGSPLAILRQVCDITSTPIQEVNPAIPSWLTATVERLQAKRPADRFGSAAEVEGLLRYNLDHPEQPQPVPPPPSLRRRRLVRRRLAGLGAIVLLLVGLVVSESLHWTHLTPWSGQAQEQPLPLVCTLTGHKGQIWSVAFAPDGRTLATASGDSTLRIWDPKTGAEKVMLPEHNSPILVVAYSHSGKFLLSGDNDGTIRVWDVMAAKEVLPVPHHGGNVRRLAISPDDKTVAVGSSTQGIELWDLERRSLRKTLPGLTGSILPVAFSPDGKILATGDESGRIRLWDPATGTEQASFQADPLGLRALTFTPDGQTLASVGTGDKDVKLWKVATQEQTGTLPGSEAGIMNVAISPDGRLLAAGGMDGVVKLWDLPAERLLRSFHAHQGSTRAVAFSPDSRYLATGGEDRLGKVWDLGGLSTP